MHTEVSVGFVEGVYPVILHLCIASWRVCGLGATPSDTPLQLICCNKIIQNSCINKRILKKETNNNRNLLTNKHFILQILSTDNLSNVGWPCNGIGNAPYPSPKSRHVGVRIEYYHIRVLYMSTNFSVQPRLNSLREGGRGTASISPA